jgi:hypothetical protein
MGCNLEQNSHGMTINGKTINGYKCENVKLNLDGYELHPPSVIVHDFMKILPKEENFPKIDGILSLKSFKNHIISIDALFQTLTLETDSSCMKLIKDMKPMETEFRTRMDKEGFAMFVKAESSMGSLWFEVDSGRYWNVLNKKYEDKFGNDAKLDPKGNEKNLDLVISGLNSPMTPMYFKFENIPYDGILGFDFISQHILMIDLKQGKTWITQNVDSKRY